MSILENLMGKKIKLSRDEEKELENIEKEAYLRKLKELLKKRGEETAEKEVG